VSVGLSGFNKSDKVYYRTVALLLGATVQSGHGVHALDVLVAKHTSTRRAAAAAANAPSIKVVRSDWIMACWAQATLVDTARFVWGAENADDDDDDETLLTQRPFALPAARALKHSQQPVARSVNESVFSLSGLKKTATSWWSRFVGDVPQPPPQAQPRHELSAPLPPPPPPMPEPVVQRPLSPQLPPDEPSQRSLSQNDDPQLSFATDGDDGALDDDVPYGGGGAATQQAMALSQRFLPCVPVQFEDFASQRSFLTTFAGATQAAEEPDVKYNHKRKRSVVEPLSPVVSSVPPEPEQRQSPSTTEATIHLEPSPPQPPPPQPPAKKARKRKGKKKDPTQAPTEVVIVPDEGENEWGSDQYAGASHLDPRALLVIQGVEEQEREREREEAERKLQKQRRAAKQLKNLGVDEVAEIHKVAAQAEPSANDNTQQRRRRTRKRKASHAKL